MSVWMSKGGEGASNTILNACAHRHTPTHTHTHTREGAAGTRGVHVGKYTVVIRLAPTPATRPRRDAWVDNQVMITTFRMAKVVLTAPPD